LVSISKTLLKAKRRISFRGVYLVKGKAFETGGEISNLENASCNLIHIPLTIYKKNLKRFSKNLQKQVVQSWSKMLNKIKAIHSYLVKLSVGLIPSNLCTFQNAN
jgi:hypothetical protein